MLRAEIDKFTFKALWLDDEWENWKELTENQNFKEPVRQAQDKLKNASQSKGKGLAASAWWCRRRDHQHDVSLVSPAGSFGKNRFIPPGNPTPYHMQFYSASWNVEELIDIKLWELISVMKRRRISIMSIQETRVSKSLCYYTENWFLVI